MNRHAWRGAGLSLMQAVAGILALAGCAGGQATREPAAPVTSDRPSQAPEVAAPAAAARPGCFPETERLAQASVRRDLQAMLGDEPDRSRRAVLLLRLAELDVQEADGCARAASETAAGTEGRAHLEGLEHKLRQAAVEAYQRLRRDTPDHARADEALFGLAGQLEALGDREAALKVHQELIARYPASRFLPHAYLAFAEHYFERADLEHASLAYRKVLDLPHNDLRTYARYKLAWCSYNLGDLPAALEGFAAVCQESLANPARGSSLAQEALKDWLRTLASLSPADVALAAIQRLAPEQAVELLDRLAGLYQDLGQLEDSRRALEHRAALCAARPGGCPPPADR
ncbi:MAG TPA: tetratricopeptide repeat protein [Myxococcota bacterium]|nr:tetratricopeptide repeat protein [Myxococcota bacterium]HRY97094.1 tetratricopeptide repeat protein [Myxococcota bacterium]HSA22241.1 tetratricopeptide repeat protein [Myxococcota bacterium]